MKVLFLTRYPVEGASSRYRVYQYLEELKSLGVESRVSSFMTSTMYSRVFLPGHGLEKLLRTLLAVVRRIWVVLHAYRYDLVVFQRELLPFGPPLLERYCRFCGVATVFDYDDALFVHKDSTHNRIASRLRRPDKTAEIFSLVDAVSAGNNYLAESAKPYCRNAVTIEVAEDTRRIPLRDYANNDRVVIGWLGSQSTEKYLELIRPALERLFQEKSNIEMRVIGGGNFSLSSSEVVHIPWSLEAEVSELLKFDIGLMPLPLEEWSRGKSGGKARTYMAAGIVPVCTGIGYNLELIRNAETGFLVKTENEWLDCLTRLVTDSNLREQVGRAARLDVEQRFSLAGQAEKLFQLFQVVLQKKHVGKGN